jgi:ABC-type transport system involved in multi-copper enzyme maturation permease subunit
VFRFFGPVLRRDLAQLARERRYVVLRTLYAATLLLLLVSLYLWWFWNLPPRRRPTAQDLSRFAELFFLTFMAAEFVIVLLLTPIYTAGVITDEKDRGTLEFLLASDLTNREIVLGKATARLASLALLVLTGLPILSFTQFFGGIEPALVLGGYAALGLTMTSLAGLSVLQSTYARKSGDAIALTFLTAAGFFGATYLIDPAAAAVGAGNPYLAAQRLLAGWNAGKPLTEVLPDVLRDYAIVHLATALLCVTWAVLRLRAVARKRASVGTPKEKQGRRWRRPVVGRQPMLW